MTERIYAKNESKEQESDKAAKKTKQIIGARGTALAFLANTLVDGGRRRFVVMDVFKKYSGKWFILGKADANPVWPPSS